MRVGFVNAVGPCETSVGDGFEYPNRGFATTKPQWYEFHFLARWYDANKPAETLELRSTPLRIEFRPSVEELIG
jgi:hypothetical protein